ncbi:MAG: hypothetical protein KatS3mg105_2565 [Gemmatales bacterium]|nr:MAG: hypothetical protein KatS3mg105_2565 [Gemmatales bacterium]
MKRRRTGGLGAHMATVVFLFAVAPAFGQGVAQSPVAERSTVVPGIVALLGVLLILITLCKPGFRERK